MAIDGTKILRNASKHSAVSYGHAVHQMKLAGEQIAQLLQKAEEADSTPLQNDLTIPDEIKRRQDRIAKQAKEQSSGKKPRRPPNHPNKARATRPHTTSTIPKVGS